MKALVLAAGFGTRLAPHTEHLPKALFPVAGTPVLARMIVNLKRAGCTAIAVNTHHLASQIQDFLKANDPGLPITLSHEDEILGTGGAIRRLADFWDEKPFMVVNADIVTDIDLGRAYRAHRPSQAMATLVLHDRPPFNQVWVDEVDRITGFERFSNGAGSHGHRMLAFTGIHIMDRRILDWIPASGFCDVIAVYRQMIDNGIPVNARVVEGHYWQDMGSPERYRDAVVDAMAPRVFRSAFPDSPADPVQRQDLSGDGSDRRWFRLICGTRRLILADHGITPSQAGSEVNAFVRIGTHLRQCGIPVPRIVDHDGFSGLVFLEDLGDRHLQQSVCRSADANDIAQRYRRVIDTWLNLTERAAAGFDPDWTCQSRAYDEALIIEKECHYFVNAFLRGYLNIDVADDYLTDEFDRLARSAIAKGVKGLIHRDLQSRNIMIHDGRHYLIDFQGARPGPIQYDLASLLIDPYVELGEGLRQNLLAYAARQAAQRRHCTAEDFLRGYRYCAITRNLQMLGAFGFLSRVKGKRGFEMWIPAAVAMLAGHIRLADAKAFPRLLALAEKIRPG